MSTQPSTFVHANPNALSVPTNIQEIPAWAQEIKNLLLAMNQNLSLVIGQAAAHHTDIGTTQATLNNHDSTAAASGSSLALATKAPKLATPDKFDGSDKNKAISFRVAVSHYLRISYPGSTVDEQIAFIISCLDGKAHEWLEPYLEEDVVKGNPDFQTYSQGLGYNNPSLRDMFYDGLSHKIKETLMVQDYDHADASVTLATLAEKALKVDQRLEQFAAQHKGSSPLQTNLEANPAPLRQQQPRERPG
ncbi:hypothetical protein RHS01_00327 [Rhizoctonia solani]|uniref:DUF4939 domain-containing protein n=1 Tax=Rhizoctonia solani TaxID=456999 RepID=A0A8H7M952_9AGAM|nr:hypothetical protein RHS01_00327 [Rhizoctonia solani]